MDSGVQKAFLLPAFLFAILYCGVLSAQNILNYREVKFHHLTTENGLPDNIVYRVVQDKKGFIWMATANGLVRYDGMSFKTYLSIPGDSTSLPDNIVRDIVIMPNGVFYLATNSGLTKFYPETEQFEYMHTARHPVLMKKKINLTDFIIDSKQRFWFVFADEIIVFDTRSEKVAYVINKKNCNASIWKGGRIEFRIEDRDGYFWFSYLDNGFFRLQLLDGKVEIKGYERNFNPKIKLPFNARSVYEGSNGDLYFDNNGLFVLPYNKKNTEEFESIDLFHGKLPQKDLEFSIHNMLEDNEHNIWIVTQNYGIKKYNPSTKQVEHLNYTALNYKNEASRIGWLNKDHNNNIWIVFTNGVLAKYNYTTRQFTGYRHDPTNPVSLPKEIRNMFFQDHSGVYWLCTPADGVTFFDLAKAKFPLYKEFPNSRTGLTGNNAMGLLEDPEGYFWLGIQNSGLNIINLYNGSVQCIKPEMGKDYIGVHNVFSVAKVSEKEFWLGSIPLKRFTFDYQHQKFNLVNEYRPNKDIEGSYSSWATLYILKDSKNDVYFGTIDNGMELYKNPDKKYPNGYFKHYPYNSNDPKGIAGLQVWHIMEDAQNRLWISTNGGISLMNKERTKFTNFFADGKTAGALSHPNVKMCLQDKKGRYWIATEGGGLNRYYEKENRFEAFNKSNGFPTDNVYAVFDDPAGNLWMSSSNGVIKFNPETKESNVFTADDGLQGTQFLAGAFHKGKSGKIYFGGSRGVNHFYPDSIKLSGYVPKLVFTSLKISGNEVYANKSVNGKVILTKALPFTNEVVLSYRENMFSVEFAALDYSAPKNIMYAYQIEGISNEWIKTNANDRKIAFANLPHGKYTITVKSTNADGVWGNNAVSLKITITPPFWKTYWFRTIFVLFLIASLYGWYLARTRWLRLQRIVLERKVNERTAEINRQKEELSIKNIELFQQKEEVNSQKEELSILADNLQESNILLREHSEELEAFSKELKVQGEELYLANEELARTNATKDRFFSIIAHDLKNPFQSIIGLSEILSEKFAQLSESKRQELFGYVHDSSKSAYNLLENLLQWARSQTGKIEFSPTVVQLKDIVQTAIQLLELQAVNKQIQLIIDIPASITAYCDTNMLETIIRNLVSNAIKFTPNNGTITIQSSTVNHQSLITVTDTGVGMPPEVVKKLFRIDVPNVKTGTAGETGTGLGLILCKEFAEKNGGRIQVESEPGKGSTFTLWLPAIDTAGANMSGISTTHPEPKIEEVIENEKPTLSSDGELYHILIVDDNPNIRKGIVIRMAQQYKITEASNGKEALQIALTELPDLIVSDVMMPEMDGFELCNILKKDERTNHIPIILLTARVSDNSRIHGLTLGADDYLTKPFNTEMLKVRIQNLLHNRELLRERYRKIVVTFTHDKPIVEVPDDQNKPFIEKVIAIIEKNMADPEFSVDKLAEISLMSKSTFYRKIVSITTQNPGELIKTMRLQKAAQLIRSENIKVSEVMSIVGYTHHSNFNDNFKKMFGMLPSEYREKNK